MSLFTDSAQVGHREDLEQVLEFGSSIRVLYATFAQPGSGSRFCRRTRSLAGSVQMQVLNATELSGRVLV